MKPLYVLLVSFFVCLFLIKTINNKYDVALSARIAMSVMLCFTAIGHFLYTKGMAMMMPSFIPLKTGLVYLTGVFEILLAIGLVLPKFKFITAWILIVFLILMLPVNIYEAWHNVDYQKASYDGPGLSYLWFRIPLQFFFILWVYSSSIRMS